MKCLHCEIIDLIAQHVTEAEGRGEKVDILPVVHAVAKALGQVIAAAESRHQQVGMLFVTATTLKAEIAMAAEQDRAASADAGEPVTAGSVH